MKIEGTIGFVGTGNMGEALIRGLLKVGVAEPSQVGAVEFKVLTSGTRGAAETETITVGDEQPFVPLAMQIDRAATSTEEGELLFEIRDAAAEVVWTRSLLRDEVRETIRETGIVTFLVPADLLSPAGYTMRVTPAGEAEPAVLLDVPFEIRRN